MSIEMLLTNAVGEKGELGTAEKIGGGGGGGGGTDNRYIVEFTESGGVYTANKPYAKIAEAFSAGKEIVADIGTGLLPMVSTGSSFYTYFAGVDGTSLTVISLSSGDVVTVAIVDVAPTTITVTTATPSIAAADNTIYECGELTSLTVSSFPATGEFSIVFISGATATVLSVPNTMIMPDGFAVEASTRYEINVKNGYAVVGSWSVSS